MNAEKISIVVSPENVSGDLFNFSYSGSYYSEQCGLPIEEDKTFLFGLYSGFSQVLSGGTNGTSLLTGLTIPITFTQSINDIGFYSEFDGFLLQKNIVTNFLYSGNPTNTYSVTLYNTSGNQFMPFLMTSNYTVDWGDGSVLTNLTPTTPSATHLYPATPSGYTITLTQNNPWGVTTVKKPISLPTTGATVTNPEGEIYFTQQGGNWSGIPINYNYIFSGDSGYDINQYLTSNEMSVPFVVSGFTTSKITRLRRYGPNPYVVGYIVTSYGVPIGRITDMTPTYTAYTINNIDYFDLSNGKTYFLTNSSGVTSNSFTFSALTKNEYLLDFVMDPEVQSSLYVERGKYSAFESILRLGEVDNMGDLIRYGYGYFTIKDT